jgi:hypothetical protein
VSVRVASQVTLGLTPPTGSPSQQGVSTFAYRTELFMGFSQSQTFNTDAGDNVVDLGAITSVKALYLQSETPINVKLTSAAGTAQLVPVDSVLYLVVPNRPITGITLVGASRGTIALAGD